MKYLSILLALLLNHSIATAAPNTIEIIGLVPGVSTKAQVEQADASGFIIGGYKLLCVPEYIDDVLSKFVCLTGKDMYSIDTTAKESFRIASNVEVYKVLLAGFTKKFGVPAKIDTSSARNKLGTEFERQTAIWLDKAGNRLLLTSMATKIDEGALIMESAQNIKKDRAEETAADQQRKF